MAKICSWCGNQVRFADLEYSYEVVANKNYCVCGECSQQISSARKGEITFDEIVTENTVPELFKHVAQRPMPSVGVIQKNRIIQEQQQLKKESQQTDPLYDDIHQIAGDLRFIKNWLIFCIVVGFIAAFFWLIAILSH